jgi:hypothetical protein
MENLLDTQDIIDVDSDAPSEDDNSLHNMPTLDYDTDEDVQTSPEIGTQPSHFIQPTSSISSTYISEGAESL